jgi:hypothetical protein
MVLPDDVRDVATQQLARFCEERIPKAARAQIRLEFAVKGPAITLVERRAPWDQQLEGTWTTQPIAQLRYDAGTATWALYWPRHTGRWHRYEQVCATSDVASLLAEIDADPDGVFWG